MKSSYLAGSGFSSPPLLSDAGHVSSLLRWSPPGSRSTLGRLTCAGADRIAIGVAATCGMLALLLTTPAITTVTTIAICGAIVTALAHLARREDGINGDFMGACIAGCEGTVLLAASMG